MRVGEHRLDVGARLVLGDAQGGRISARAERRPPSEHLGELAQDPLGLGDLPLAARQGHVVAAGDDADVVLALELRADARRSGREA